MSDGDERDGKVGLVLPNLTPIFQIDWQVFRLAWILVLQLAAPMNSHTQH